MLKDWGLCPGDVIPRLELKDISGEIIELFDPAFDTVMLVLTSVKCAPGQNINSILTSYQEKHPDIKIIALFKDNVDEVSDAIKHFNMENLPVVLLTEDIMSALLTNHFPLAFLISTGHDPNDKRKGPVDLRKGMVIMKGLPHD
jgi:hypothetical protein